MTKKPILPFVYLMLIISGVLFAADQFPTATQLQQWNSYMFYTKEMTDQQLLDVARSNYDCYLVPHTHWDKEWGFSFEQHRVRLVKLIDNTIEILENDPEYRCFTLDGQSSLIADYLEVRPEMRERVKALAASGRLLIGPAYSQIDMLVSSGEEIIRNMLVGIRTARDAGGVSMFAHSADNFGYCAQTPQIYFGLGFDGASFYRGPDDSQEYSKNLFKWQGLDGNSSVNVVNLTGPSGYLLFTWPFDVPELPEALLLRTLPYIAPKAVTDKILLPGGSDALEPGADLPKVIERLGNTFPNMKFRISSFKEFHDHVMAQNPDLPSHQGMMRTAHACFGSISARLNMKRHNAEAYTTLENFAEPFSALSWLVTGRRYPATSIDQSWKYLFENLTHDDMAGYAIDPVHKINWTRYFEANRLAETLAIRGMKTLIEQIDTPDKGDVLNHPVVVFNSLPWKRSDVVETMFSVTARGRSVDPFKEGKYSSFDVVDMEGNKCAAEIFQCGSDNYRIRFLAKDVPAFGYKTYKFVANKKEIPKFEEKTNARILQNKLVKLTFYNDGRFDLLDKTTSVTYPKQHYFQNQQMPRSTALSCTFTGDTTSTMGQIADITLVQDSPLSKTVRVEWNNWQVPVAPGSPEMVNLPVKSYITLTAGLKRVDIYTEIENNSTYHMVSANFPTLAKVDSFQTGVQFGAQTAPVFDSENPPTGPWGHQIYPHLDWCDVSDGQTGLAILDRGTPVVSVFPKKEQNIRTGSIIQLPIFRSCASKSEDIRPSIPYNRFSSETHGTEAQLIGTQRIHYSLFPHIGDWQEAKIYQKGQEAATRLWPEMLHINDYSKWQIGPYGFQSSVEYPEPSLPSEFSFLEVKTDGILLSALKKAESGEAIIARFFNTTGEQKIAKIDFFEKADKVIAVDLLEENADDLPFLDWKITDTSRTFVKLTMRPFQIVTLRFKVNAPEEKRWHHMIY